ncbi:F-box/kelch-repeat protein At1g57790-like [Magnolia sinica]|uniref:F-box/kelch-repeat protein At1g57790-like n=1 Tax=Magnolia sinica TaxID=86752 RepID=UPI0026584249|nr:F-box/kelch-repeat protein At1g57790-like [Magnolia sinica]XP_058079398.1 F-box/kelch-repeat protein At1g57790-like [Magnolia sinica]XP_058079399.1 F-box/kelch-repeat protein At1g57790-like [Magnolia sinica]
MPKDLEEIQQENTNLGDMEDIFEITPSKKTEIVEYRTWSDLPIDLLELIALHLFRADFVHLISSCRSWRSIAPLNLITKRHLSLFSSRGLPFLRNHSPWLMYFGKGDGMCNFLDPLYNDRYFINIPELSGSTITFCKDGWVFMCRGEHCVFLFNPFIKAKIELPDLEYRNVFNCITFSSTPTSSDSTIFAVNTLGGSVTIYICRRGDMSWIEDHLPSNLPFTMSYSNPVFKDEVFYVLGHNGVLGVCDPKRITWTILAKPKPLKFCNCRKVPSCKWEYYLVESRGELLMVVIGFSGTPIQVFRLEASEMEWVKMETLEDRILFVGRWTSLSSTALVKGMENKIHFPIVSGEDCVFYSLKDSRCYPSRDFYECEEYIYSTWIEPRWFQPSAEELDWSRTSVGQGSQQR